MKKHAKKSLLVPILALVSVIAIAACCYLAQSFSAFAEEEPVLEPAITSEDGAASAAEEAELDQANPSGNSIMARIHFSTDDIMTGNIESLEGSITPFWPTTVLAHEFTFEGEYQSISYIESDPIDHDDIISIYVLANGLPSEKVNIQIPGGKILNYNQNPFCDPLYLNGADDNSVDITVSINPFYYLCFDANGGTFKDNGLPFQYIKVVQGSGLEELPLQDHMNPPFNSENGRFAGGFTERYGGEQVFTFGSQTPVFGTYYVLYAHGAGMDNPEQPINVNIMCDNGFQQFHYDLNINGKDYHDDTGFISLFDLYDKYNIETEYWLNGLNLGGAVYANGSLFGPENLYIQGEHGILQISAKEDYHFNGITWNGDFIPNSTNSYFIGMSNINNIVISTSVNTPGYIGVSSDNGSLFKCTIQDSNSPLDIKDVVSDYIPIYVNSDEKVMYYYGRNDAPLLLNNTPNLYNSDANQDTSGISLIIIVRNPITYQQRNYVFRDNLFTLFDGFNINTYIKGVNLDGEPLLSGQYERELKPGFRNFTLRMSDHAADTSVTYKANGGAFADGSDSMTLDATYGEPLPLVENPTLAENDFVGWFTEPEGGVEVDPENFHWMPGQKWEGVTLYAHGAYNPQPVPPEPVPPTPPEPVNPDVPGGGGTAQTGDNSGIAFAIAGMLALCGACGFAAAARSRKNFSTWF